MCSSSTNSSSIVSNGSSMLISRLLNSGSSGNSSRLVRCVAVLIAL